MKKDIRFLIFVLIFAFVGVGSIFFMELNQDSVKSYTRTFFLLDTAIQLDIYTDQDEDDMTAYLDGIEEKLTEYHQLTDQYNAYEGVVNVYALNHSEETLVVDDFLFELISLSKDFEKTSNKEFNIAYNNVLLIWHDYRERALSALSVIAALDYEAINEMDDQTALDYLSTYDLGLDETTLLEVIRQDLSIEEAMASELKEEYVPTESMLEEASLNTSIDDVILDETNQTVYLANGVTIDLGGSAKGYIAAKLREDLLANGFEYFLINAGGNIVAGKHPEERPWRIGLEDPNNPTDLYIRVELEDMSAVTSGDYQRYYEIDGTRYHHIIDPTTNYPATHYRSCTVLTSQHELADLISTTIFLLPLDEAKELIESMDGVEAIWYLLDDSLEMSSGFEGYVMSSE